MNKFLGWYGAAITILALVFVSTIFFGYIFQERLVARRVELAIQENEDICQLRIDSLNGDANYRIRLAYYRGGYNECYMQTRARAPGEDPISFCQWRGLRVLKLDGHSKSPALGWEWLEEEIEKDEHESKSKKFSQAPTR